MANQRVQAASKVGQPSPKTGTQNAANDPKGPQQANQKNAAPDKSNEARKGPRGFLNFRR